MMSIFILDTPTGNTKHSTIEDCVASMRHIVTPVCVMVGPNRDDIIWEGDPEIYSVDELMAEIKEGHAEYMGGKE